MTDGNEESTIYDYLSQNFSIKIGETLTCLTCETKIFPKLSKDFSLILSLEKKFEYGKKLRQISHKKKEPFGEELCDNERFDGHIL